MQELTKKYIDQFKAIIESNFKCEKRPTVKLFSAQGYDKKLNLVINKQMNSNFFSSKEFMNFYSEFRKYYYYSLGALIRNENNKMDQYLYWIELKNAMLNAEINFNHSWK